PSLSVECRMPVLQPDEEDSGTKLVAALTGSLWVSEEKQSIVENSGPEWSRVFKGQHCATRQEVASWPEGPPRRPTSFARSLSRSGRQQGFPSSQLTETSQKTEQFIGQVRTLIRS